MRKVPKQFIAGTVLVLVLCAAFAGYRATRLHYIRQCVQGYRALWKAQDAAVQEESFVPAGVPADALDRGGAFYLQDARNKVWVFTPALVGMTADVARSRSRLIRVCGFGASRVSKMSLPVNNRVYDGSVEEYLPAQVRIEGRQQFMLLPADAARKVLAGLLVFEYLFGPESSVNWILRRDSIVCATGGTGYALHETVDREDAQYLCPDLVRRIDRAALNALNNSRKQEYAGVPASRKEWRMFYSPRTIDILDAAARANLVPDQNLLSMTARLIEEMPDEEFLDLLRIGGLNATKEYASYTSRLLEKKNRIIDFFRVFLGQLADVYQERFEPDLNKRYTIKDFKDIIASLREPLVAPAGQAGVDSGKRQRMLVMAESPEAVFVVQAFRTCALGYDEALSALVRLRGMAAHELEKSAVDFYIREMVTGHITTAQPCTEHTPAGN